MKKIIGDLSHEERVLIGLEDPALAAVPVVLLSADVTTETASATLGVAGYLKKPVKLAALLETVARFTGGDGQGYGDTA